MLGMSTSSFYSKLSTLEAVEKIAQLDIKVIEVFLNTFSEYTEEFINEIGGRIKDNNLVFNSVHTLPTQFEPQLFAITQNQYKDALCFFKSILINAKKYGCKQYVMHGKPYHYKNPLRVYDVSKIAKRLNELCDISGEIDISLECVHWAMCNNYEFIEYIKKNVPKLKFTLDCKQAILANMDPIKCIDIMQDRLTNVHICGVNENKSTCLPNEGSLDFDKISKKLKSVGYNRNVIIEVYPNDYYDYNQLINAIEYCKSIFY